MSKIARVETNWYVLTGAPSSGKTSTLLHMGYLGYHIVPEAARIHIEDEQSKGLTLARIRPSEVEFSQTVTSMRRFTEGNVKPETLAFIDRGIPDALAYDKVYGTHTPDITEADLWGKRYRGVFLLDRLPLQKDNARIEDDTLAEKLEVALLEVYQGLGYKVQRIPVMPISARAHMIQGIVHS